MATSSWTLSRGYFELVFVATSSWTLSHGFFELATACWTWSRGCFELCLYGVATSSWTMSCGYFELVLVLAKLLRQCRGPGGYSALRSRLFKVSGEKNFGFCGER